MINKLKTYCEAFIGLLYPQFCAACDVNLLNQEEILCTKCLYELPRTNFHKITDNPIEQIFWGRVPVEKATSFYFFNQGSKYRKLIHKLKYQSQPNIGITLGKLFAADLLVNDYYRSIDYIIPVPLHNKKLRKRGYNQSEVIGKGMAEILPATLDVKTLIRNTFTQTQTQKNRFERWENVEHVFGLHRPEKLINKKILLIDDVLTTGATLEGCAQILHRVEGIQISIATLGFTSMS